LTNRIFLSDKSFAGAEKSFQASSFLPVCVQSSIFAVQSQFYGYKILCFVLQLHSAIAKQGSAWTGRSNSSYILTQPGLLYYWQTPQITE
jgi:hypothetical protein